MIVGSIRSGLVEAVHPVAAAAVDADGHILAVTGDAAGREFFLRSAIKPIQAAVTERHGAALGLEQLAVAASSHRGLPIHIAYVEQMLDEAGLTTGHLRCPPDRPSDAASDRLWAAAGRRDPEPVFHNCSGKHAAMLRACRASGWSLEYEGLDHPLQQAAIAMAEAFAGRSVTPTGVDGCGVPTLRSDVVGLARTFAGIAVEPEMSRVRAATMRFPALTRDGERAETEIARWVPTIVKGGAMGCLGVAWPEGGIGFAAKCWTGEGAAANVAVLTLMVELGILSGHPLRQLEPVITPVVLGGGRPVGSLAVIER